MPPHRDAPASRYFPFRKGLASIPSPEKYWLERTEICPPVPILTSNVFSSSPAAPRKLAWLSPIAVVTVRPLYVPSFSISVQTSGSQFTSTPISASFSFSKHILRLSKNPKPAALLTCIRGFFRPVKYIPK